MPPTYLLPVITTKEQIGLSHVTNDEQLKKASNLEDISDVTLARTNLGLGDAAIKSIGSSSDDVAAGNHNHNGVYAPALGEDDNYVTDADLTKLSDLSGTNTGDQDLSGYSQIMHDHTEEDVTDLDKYSQTEINLIMQRLKGISLTQNDLLYMYNHNTKLIATCEGDESWTNGYWGVGYAATHGDDTSNYKVGSQGISITSSNTSAEYMYLDFADKDLSKFADGSASTTDDYIEFALYSANVSKINQAIIRIPCDAVGTTTNYFTYVFNGVIANGWNHLQISKSAFSTTGSASWDDVKGVVFNIRSTDGTEVSYTLDSIRMTRCDPDDSVPNPLQLEVDGAMERLFEVYTGTLFLGYDGSDLVLKALENTYIYGTYDPKHELYANMTGITSASGLALIFLYSNANNRAYFGLNSDYLYAYSVNNATATPYYSTAFPVDAGDEIVVNGSIVGKSVYGHISKSGIAKGWSVKNTVDVQDLTFTLQILIYEDASITSFKAGSSPLITNI